MRGLGATEETKDSFQKIIVSVLRTLNTTYFDPEFFTHYYGYRKHSQILSLSIAEANLHADYIQQQILNSYSYHTTQECLPGITFFRRFRGLVIFSS